MFSAHNKIHKDKGLAPTEFEEQVAQVSCFMSFGHCLEDEHHILVYEFMPRGSLENHLFRIALGAAKGLAFLHGSETRVIYKDFKTSNILLDSEYNAKLSDFGLAKDGPVRDNMQLLNISRPLRGCPSRAVVWSSSRGQKPTIS